MRNKKKLAIFFLILILAVPLFNKIIHLVRQSVWDGKSHINIAIDNGGIEVWSIEPSEKTVHVVVIPKNVYLSLGSYGAYRASALGRFSLLEKKDGSLVSAAIEETLAVPVDGYVVRKEGTENSLDPIEFFGPSGFLKAITKRPLSGRVTNLTSLDVWRLWMLTFSLRTESIERIALDKTNAVAKMTLPDGGEGLTLDQEQFFKLALQYFADKYIEDEDLTIEVINGTTIAGAANSAARMLTNIGGNVVNTAKSEEEAQQTLIQGETKSYTAAKIAKLFNGKISEERVKESRVDIRILLGGE